LGAEKPTNRPEADAAPPPEVTGTTPSTGTCCRNDGVEPKRPLSAPAPFRHIEKGSPEAAREEWAATYLCGRRGSALRRGRSCPPRAPTTSPRIDGTSRTGRCRPTEGESLSVCSLRRHNADTACAPPKALTHAPTSCRREACFGITGAEGCLNYGCATRTESGAQTRAARGLCSANGADRPP
jgi:hypothetical protein